ncbi:MAG: biotin transporter BioY [Fidelibacterota bacterium]
MTYADVLRPSLRSQARIYDVTLVAGGSLFIALLSQIRIPLPYTPVPITGQTFGVLLAGAMLGRVRGTFSVLAYLGQGAVGLPFFAGGASGLAHLLGPTGGYLVGFVGGAYLTGFLAERGWDRKPGTTVLAMVLGNLTIFAAGLAWLGLYTRSLDVFAVGLLPFIPGDIVKIGLASVLLPYGWKWLDRD